LKHSIAINKGKVLVTFESDKGIKGDPGTFEGGKDYRGFVVAGKDRRWFTAEVTYNRGEQALEVYSDLVQEPVAVRYAWSRFSDGNLGTRIAPVPLFRSDHWPFPESGKKLSGGQIKRYFARWAVIGTHYRSRPAMTIMRPMTFHMH
jgi:hypothetical protein